jgi:hypothetical protein
VSQLSIPLASQLANKHAAVRHITLLAKGDRRPRGRTGSVEVGRRQFADVRVGSISTFFAEPTRPFMSAMPPIATKAVSRSETSRCATSRHMQCSKQHRYSITSSAMASSLSGTVRPSILAVEELMTNSNLLDCRTGRSAGLAPLRIRAA